MSDFLAGAYLWIKALHIVAVVAWMAALLYLPRLYVYHAAAVPGGEASETFKVMERRLLRAIATPAMVASLLLGLLLLWIRSPAIWSEGWWHGKLLLLLGLFVLHGLFARWRRHFADDGNRRTARFYRVANELPTLLLVGIVLLAVAKPL